MRYKIINQFDLHFLTITVVDWLDVFTRPMYKDLVIDSLKFCQKEKGLTIYAYVIMTNHLHLVVQAAGEIPLSDIVRDFKKYTANGILKLIEKNPKESRKRWLLNRFAWNAKQHAGDRKKQFWKDGNHPFALYSPKLIWQKIDYIHLNPVVAGIVEEASHYRYSSAANYSGGDGLLEVTLMDYINPVGYIPMGPRGEGE